MSEHSGKELLAGLVSIGNIDFDKITIPFYQRPYRWTTENVEQLLSDIKANSGKEEYRIGCMIIHHDVEKGTLNIVDGQQRTTTLVLILKCLGKEVPFKAEYHSSVSKTHIRENYAYIKNWLSTHVLETERKGFRDFILDHCKFIWVQTNRLYEAFQMFESQNGNGKELLPYNLLKAYHFHAFDKSNDSVMITDEKIKYDQRWEEAVKFNPADGKQLDLLDLITQRLFQIRQWSRGHEASVLTKRNIKEFKGIQIGQKVGLSQPRYNLAKLIYEALYDGEGKMKNSNPSYLFSIDMPIINGAPFFDYIDTYVEEYKSLFITKNLKGLDDFYEEYPTRCADTGRSGDKYIRRLYHALILAVYDKYREEGVSRYYRTLYDIAYRLRLEHKQVRQETVFQYPVHVFSIISESFMVDDLQQLDHYAMKEITCRKLSDKSMLKIAQYIKATGVSIVAGDLDDEDKELFKRLK